MLNEFVILQRGLEKAGFSSTPRHPDVQSPGRNEAIRIRLDQSGAPVETSLIDGKQLASGWTLRNGKRNSFPYMQLKLPLLSVPQGLDWQARFEEEWKNHSAGDRRRRLAALAAEYPPEPVKWQEWPGRGLLDSLARRRASIGTSNVDLSPIMAVLERFAKLSAEPLSFINSLVARLLLDLNVQDSGFADAARVALCGKRGKGKVDGASVYFDASRGEFARDVADAIHIGPLSTALRTDGRTKNSGDVCALTGRSRQMHLGNFPQPTLGPLGQVYLFAKNQDTPAAARYRRSGAGAISVAADLVQQLAGSLYEITAEHRKGKTWRTIPSEKPKQKDLLIAFVDTAIDVPVADALVDDGEYDEEDGEWADRRADFLTRTERVVQAIKGKAGADFRKTPVTLCILRKVDLGNAKTILHRAVTVGDLHDAATEWERAERNLPDWLSMAVPTKAKRVVQRGAPHIAPLQLQKLTQAFFIRGGTESAVRPPVGITAQDALTLFLNEAGAERVARTTLRLVLGRQSQLAAGAAHALRKDSGAEKFKHALPYDRSAAVKTLGMLGIFLSKLGRRREEYMSSVAFKLGQMLAVADAVHIGYSLSVRGGDVPPTLLGNSVLTTAQSDPVKALAVLSRRWKPYGAWAKRPEIRDEAERLKNSPDKKQKDRGWAILRSVSQARRADELCRELHGKIPQTADDIFRAELLLGYVAGLPPFEPKPSNAEDQEEG